MLIQKACERSCLFLILSSEKEKYVCAFEFSVCKPPIFSCKKTDPIKFLWTIQLKLQKLQDSTFYVCQLYLIMFRGKIKFFSGIIYPCLCFSITNVSSYFTYQLNTFILTVCAFSRISNLASQTHCYILMKCLESADHTHTYTYTYIW